MRMPPIPEPEGLALAKERIAAIKARFRPSSATFAQALSQVSLPGPGAIQQAITSAAAEHGIDPAVLSALAYVESGFRADAVSPKGALGIAQLMPGTARALGVTDPFDLRSALDGGARYLRQQLDRFGGDLTLALAAYNAGPGAVARHGGIPPYSETRRFVSRVLDLVPRFSPQP